MSDNPKEAEREIEKAIFISADCWHKVFDLLPPFQLGFGIAMISRRFDYFVDEHYKTRKWTLTKEIQIIGEIGQNGAREMKIVNFGRKELPIPQIPLPNKVMAFRGISIYFIDQNVITFLGHFHRFFANCATSLSITTENVHILEFAVFNIWPMFKDVIREITFPTVAFRQMRQFAPSMLNDCTSLRLVIFHYDILLEFPPDDSANASDGQAVAKWLLTPRHDNSSKELNYFLKSATEHQWSEIVEQIKTEFFNASSPVAFRILFDFSSSFQIDSVVPFELTNEFTGEQLELSSNAYGFVIIRRPIVPKERQQMKLGYRWNQIYISIGLIDDGLLDGLPGQSDDQQQEEMDISVD